MPQRMPSLTLVLDLDERIASSEVRLEVKRCWAYVCSCALRTHSAPEDSKPVNTAQFLVKMGTDKYLHSSDEGADELWNGVIEKWLASTFYKVGNQMKIYNRRQRETGGVELYFDWLDVDLENKGLVVSVRLDSNSDIAPEVHQVISSVRAALNAGALGSGVTRVQMPTDESYARQYVEGMAAKAEREAAAQAEAEAEAQAEAHAAAQAVEQAAEDFVESPDLVEDPELDELKAIEEELEAKFALPEADFAIDYTLWTVFFEDGTTRTYDSAAGGLV